MLVVNKNIFLIRINQFKQLPAGDVEGSYVC